MALSLKVFQDKTTKKTNESKLSELLRQYEEFKLSTEQLSTTNDKYVSLHGNENAPYYNFTRTELGKKIYLYTKIFLDTHKDILLPEEKGEVFRKYIEFWANERCELHIKYTEYADEYKKHKFGKYRNRYNECVPMVAGFNLQGAILGKLHASFSIFLSVNFKEADFSNATLPYSHFENCDLSGIKTNKTNLCQGRFKTCNFQHANLQGSSLSEANFNECNLKNTDLKGVFLDNVNFNECNMCNSHLDNKKHLHLFNCNFQEDLAPGDKSSIKTMSKKSYGRLYNPYPNPEEIKKKYFDFGYQTTSSLKIRKI